jgi:hypoxanthine phosphoribosyltransferase
MKTKSGLTYVSWSDLDMLVTSLAHTIKASGRTFSCIAGVSRGGLIPAVMLSHKLKLPMIPITPNDMIENDHETVIVDEIYDTGKTIQKVKLFNPRAAYAVLFHNEHLPELDFYCVKRDLVDWLVFPWEVEDGPRPV